MRLEGYRVQASEGDFFVKGEEESEIGMLWFDDARSTVAPQTMQSVAILGRELAPSGVKFGDRQRYYVFLLDQREGGKFERMGWVWSIAVLFSLMDWMSSL